MKYIIKNNVSYGLSYCLCGDNCGSKCGEYKNVPCVPNCPGYGYQWA